MPNTQWIEDAKRRAVARANENLEARGKDPVNYDDLEWRSNGNIVERNPWTFGLSAIPFLGTSVGAVIDAQTSPDSIGGSLIGAATGDDDASLTDAVFGKPADPNSGLNSAIDYYNQVYGGVPGIDGNTMFDIPLPELSQIQAETYDPFTITYGDQGQGYGNNGAPQGFQGLGTPGLNRIPTGRGPTMTTLGGDTMGLAGPRRVGTGGEAGIARPRPNPNSMNIQALEAQTFNAPRDLGYGQALSLSGVDPVAQMQAAQIGPAGALSVERLGRAGAVPVERVGFGSQFQMIDPRSLGMDSAWREGFDMDPRTLEAQNQALDHFQMVMEGDGWDPVSEAAYQRRVAEAEVRRRGQAQAVMREQELQGLGGSGMDVMAQLMTGQSSASDQYLAALDAAALQANRMDTAGTQLGSLGGQMRSQEFGEHAARAGALDSWDQFMGNAILNSSQVNSGRAMDVALQNQAAQNQAFSQQYGLQGQYNMANADAQNRAFSQQYGLQGQYNLANADALNRASQFNIGNQMDQNLFNANARNQAATANFDRRGNVDMFNAENAYNAALENFRNASDVAKTNNRNAVDLGIFSANARNAAAQNNANARQQANEYNAGLGQQNFDNRLALQRERLGEVQSYGNLLGGRQEPNRPGLVDYVSEGLDLAGGVLGVINPTFGAARGVAKSAARGGGIDYDAGRRARPGQP